MTPLMVVQFSVPGWCFFAEEGCFASSGSWQIAVEALGFGIGRWLGSDSWELSV
jgi:hypothetical protein